MKLEKKHIDQIVADFNKMQTKDDLLRLLNLAKTFVYHEKVVPFELKQLTWYANPKLGAKRYTEFKIKKKSGAERSIHAPVETLKSLQKTLSFVLQCVFQPHEAAMGFVKDRSIVDNAKLHVGSRYVYNIDLKDFFSSIDQARVWKCLQLKPFNLITNNKVSIILEENDKEERKEDFFIPLQPGILKRREKIWMFLFRKSNYKEGCRIILTPNGNKIAYNVKKDTSKSGVITVFKDQTDIENILAIAIRQIEKLGLEVSTDAMVGFLIKEVIDKDQESLISSKKQNTITNILASLCCTEMEVERKSETGEWEKVNRNVLPQGAPTSPVITNIVCQKLDFLLSGVAKRFGLKYSRYADDITFSSMHNVYQSESEFLKELHRIISEQNFHIKESKTRLQKDGYRKEVTGLLVNEKANVQQRYIKQLRMWLYYWERYGYERASGFFLQQYITGKGLVKNNKPDMGKVISGKLDYLKMVKNADNELYLNLKSRFDKLTTISSKSKFILEREVKTEFVANKLKISLVANRSSEIQETSISSINIPENPIKPSFRINLNSFNEIKGSIRLNNIYPIHHTPLKTVDLLKFFTANDKDLKYSTHSWEEGKYNSYDEYIEIIRLEWNGIKDELKNLSPRLFAKISNYLFNDSLGKTNDKGYYNVWGEKRLKFGWSSPELKIHMNEPGNTPFSCPIPENIKALDKKYDLHYFKDYAEVFKNEIEFRESNNFKKMILDLWEKELSYDFNIIGVELLIGFSFFTDVALVKEALQKIFEMFKGKPEFSNINIEKTSNFENGGYHLFKITQMGSFITRDINDPRLKSPTGNLHSIIKHLKNLADYSIVSTFGDGKNYRINYLSSSLETNLIETLTKDQLPLGFTHELKFYL